MLETYVKKILSSKVYDLARETPLTPARLLTQRFGAQVYLKREDLQSIFSFKLRGAYNRMVHIDANQLEKGVVTASAGNHAQGVAVAADKLNVKATVVMGLNTPAIKVESVKNFGAKVILHGDSYDEAAEFANNVAESEGSTYIHPYDDPLVIAGQGTVGMEIANQHTGDIDAIFVPVGGGGLIAGIACFFKYLRPRTKIIGVEAEGSACLFEAKKSGRRVKLPRDSLDLFADGVSVAQIGDEPFKVAKHHVDAVVKVSTDEICASIKDVFEETRSIAEPAGALAVAGMKKYLSGSKRKFSTVVAIVSGANVNFDRLRHISERAEVGEDREAIFATTIKEERGSFLDFCRDLGSRSITEFNYRKTQEELANIYVGIEIANKEKRKDLLKKLKVKGYRVVDMTDNEAAKVHIRHMVGGPKLDSQDELLYRFEFPERPGALMQFLTVLGSRWDISLFHYRNHGAAWGRVLVGFCSKESERNELSSYLAQIGYRFWEEDANPAYKLFLS